MSVKIEASGRRSIEVEVEVPGTPEEVWKAIATGPGISSWFVPTQSRARDGKPIAVTSRFGPGIEPRSAVTAWDPPRTFTFQIEGWADWPTMATGWRRSKGALVVCTSSV